MARRASFQAESPRCSFSVSLRASMMSSRGETIGAAPEALTASAPEKSGDSVGTLPPVSLSSPQACSVHCSLVCKLRALYWAQPPTLNKNVALPALRTARSWSVYLSCFLAHTGVAALPSRFPLVSGLRHLFALLRSHLCPGSSAFSLCVRSRKSC